MGNKIAMGTNNTNTYTYRRLNAIGEAAKMVAHNNNTGKYISRPH